MEITITVLSNSLATEKKWAKEIEALLKSYAQTKVLCSHEAEADGQVLFIDEKLKNIEKAVEKIERKGRALFLIVSSRAPKKLPPLWTTSKVDGVVTAPFRSLELLSKLRHYEQILKWKEVSELNVTIYGVLKKLREDFRLTERLQKANFPRRFPNVKGFKVLSRYFAGQKPGGDYFDLVESRDKRFVSVVMTHSSSYGLSSAVLSVLMRVTLKLTAEQLGVSGSAAQAVRQIHEDLALTLSEKDQLSLFFGTIDQKTNVMKFYNLGSAQIYYLDPQDGLQRFPVQGGPITKASSPNALPTETSGGEIQLHPEGRLIMLSHGFVKALGGDTAIQKLVQSFRGKEAADLMNEIAYRMKAQLEDEDDLPDQDCTSLILDVETQVLRMKVHTEV